MWDGCDIHDLILCQLVVSFHRSSSVDRHLWSLVTLLDVDVFLLVFITLCNIKLRMVNKELWVLVQQWLCESVVNAFLLPCDLLYDRVANGVKRTNHDWKQRETFKIQTSYCKCYMVAFRLDLWTSKQSWPRSNKIVDRPMNGWRFICILY